MQAPTRPLSLARVQPALTTASLLWVNVWQVPYLSELGVLSVNVTGGVVEAPFFRSTHIEQTTQAEWLVRRTAAGAWADFETEKFMLSVPSSWISAFEDPGAMLRTYDLAMDATAEWGGYPPLLRERAGVHTLYLQPDLQIAHKYYGTGYPQVNQVYDPSGEYSGDHDHWMLQDPAGWPTTWHELGHTQQRQAAEFQYPGETEAIVNFLYAYVHHVKLGEPFNLAFKYTRASVGYEPDDAAVHWMITANFRNGAQMEHSTTLNEYQYQHRGYAKYADIVRLFGWEAFTSAYYQENADHEEGLARWYERFPDLSGSGYQVSSAR